MKLSVVDRIHLQINEFALGAENKAIGDSKLIDSPGHHCFLDAKSSSLTTHEFIWSLIRKVLQKKLYYHNYKPRNSMGNERSKHLFWVDIIDPYHPHENRGRPPVSSNAHGWVERLLLCKVEMTKVTPFSLLAITYFSKWQLIWLTVYWCLLLFTSGRQ